MPESADDSYGLARDGGASFWLNALPDFFVTLWLTPAVYAATPAKKASPSSPSSPVAPAMTPKQIEARREMLSRVVASHQRVMDAYERQTIVKKGLGLSEAQYLAAKKARDAAQSERDSLANRS